MSFVDPYAPASSRPSNNGYPNTQSGPGVSLPQAPQAGVSGDAEITLDPNYYSSPNNVIHGAVKMDGWWVHVMEDLTSTWVSYPVDGILQIDWDPVP